MPATPNFHSRTCSDERFRGARALYLQRHARGLVVRAARKRHATAAARSQKPHRTQRQSIAATMINNSMRNLLREKQHRAQIESAGSLVTDAGSQHERSAAALKQTKSTMVISGGGSGRSLFRLATAVASNFERKESYHTELDGPIGDDGSRLLVEHCGWLLKQGRAINNWKVRWVIVQASCLWYFKDDTRSELLGVCHWTVRA